MDDGSMLLWNYHCLHLTLEKINEVLDGFL